MTLDCEAEVGMSENHYRAVYIKLWKTARLWQVYSKWQYSFDGPSKNGLVYWPLAPGLDDPKPQFMHFTHMPNQFSPVLGQNLQCHPSFNGHQTVGFFAHIWKLVAWHHVWPQLHDADNDWLACKAMMVCISWMKFCNITILYHIIWEQFKT